MTGNARATESIHHKLATSAPLLSCDHPRAIRYATRLSSIPGFNILFVVLLRHVDYIIPFVPSPPIGFRLDAPRSIPELPVLIFGLPTSVSLAFSPSLVICSFQTYMYI